MTKPEILACEKHGPYEVRTVAMRGLTITNRKCGKCAAEAVTESERKAAAIEADARQRRLEKKMNQGGIPEGFRDRTFGNFLAESPAQETALGVAKRFAEGFEKHRKQGTTLAFCGSLGTGKTHLAIAIAQHVASTGHTVMYETAMDMVTRLRDTMRRDSAIGTSAMLDTIASIDLLILDEVGVQAATDDVKTHLFNIMDRRYRDARPTLILSNLSPKALREYFGPRVEDRLVERGAFVPFAWESYRARARNLNGKAA